MLKVDLGPVAEVRRAIKGHVLQRLREQRKVPGSLSDGRVPLTRKARRLRSFLKEKRGRSLKTLDIVGSALSILRLRVIIGFIVLLIG